MHTLAKIRNYFVKPHLSPEAFDAYFHRLPDNIQVSWERDEGMIVGRVTIDGQEFYTQGKNPKDFIEMVNDALYTIYGIPFDYIEDIGKMKAFRPTKEELKKLYDGRIPKSDFSLLKDASIRLA